MSKYDWSNIHKNVNWIATDKLTNTAQGYVAKPVAQFDTWYSSSDKYWLHLSGWTGGSWLESLEQRPLNN